MSAWVSSSTRPVDTAWWARHRREHRIQHCEHTVDWVDADSQPRISAQSQAALRCPFVAIDADGLYWWHSIAMPDGTVTPGEKSLDGQEKEWTTLRLPELAGRTVLDIGAWDGWFSFRAEAVGAARVVALDSFVWSLDFTRADEYWDYVHRCEALNEPYDMWGPECSYWDPTALLGKRSFDRAGTALGSSVEAVVADFMEDDLRELGSFDIALFLGVLYHMRDPLGALDRLRSMTTELAVIETAAIEVPGLDGPFMEFVPGYEVHNDPTNWFFPTEAAVHGLCGAAGFSSVASVGRLAESRRANGIVDYRLIVHARP
jgi:tRNA (mo5U34)-methyltransferase